MSKKAVANIQRQKVAAAVQALCKDGYDFFRVTSGGQV